MHEFLDNRTAILNQHPLKGDAKYVLYWMQLYKRTSHNFALNKAIEKANALRLPLVVYEGLKYYYPWASDRIHTFILEGVAEKEAKFTAMGIQYVFFLQAGKHCERDTVTKLAAHAATLITDDFPCFIVPEHNRHIAERVNIPVLAVDSNGIIPMALLAKEEYAARTIRPKIHRLLSDFEKPVTTPEVHVKATLSPFPAWRTGVGGANIAGLVAECDIDHSVAPSTVYHGGEAAAQERLRHFVSTILPYYDQWRNKPDIDGTSRLSPWLHFGFISPQQVYAAVTDADAPVSAKGVFLEELVVRRELSFNFAKHNLDNASLQSLPDWAKRTMDKHAADKRYTLFSAAQMEAGETTDTLWNATQHELAHTGTLHNYMRMLWGKKIIEWSPSYQEAFMLMEHLNNKYALDGRDPNSYAGILWCFGKHDRAWGPERAVLGTLRYLSSDSWRRKVNAAAYIRKYSRLN